MVKIRETAGGSPFADYLTSVTAIASTSTRKSGCESRRTSTVVLVGMPGAEVLHAYVDMPEELVDVGGERLGADEIAERRAGGRQRRLQVLADLTDLSAHVALADDVARLVAGEQTGHEDEFARNDGHHRRIEYVSPDDALRRASGNRFCRSIIRCSLS